MTQAGIENGSVRRTSRIAMPNAEITRGLVRRGLRLAATTVKNHVAPGVNSRRNVAILGYLSERTGGDDAVRGASAPLTLCVDKVRGGCSLQRAGKARGAVVRTAHATVPSENA
jgi:hypothetical protein